MAAKSETLSVVLVSAVCAAALLGGGFLVSCAQPHAEIDLLRSPDGLEYPFPTLEWFHRLEKMPDGTRRDMVNHLARILDSPGGYSRVVAAWVLLCLSTREDGGRILTEEAAHALARNCIRLARPYSPTSRPDLEQDSECFDLLCPEFVLFFDCEDFSLEQRGRLPKGWEAVSAQVRLDEQVIPHTIMAFPFERFGEVVANVSGRLKPEEALGRHTIEYRLVLKAPNGTLVTVEQRNTVYVLPPESPDARESGPVPGGDLKSHRTGKRDG